MAHTSLLAFLHLVSVYLSSSLSIHLSIYQFKISLSIYLHFASPLLSNPIGLLLSLCLPLVSTCFFSPPLFLCLSFRLHLSHSIFLSTCSVLPSLPLRLCILLTQTFLSLYLTMPLCVSAYLSCSLIKNISNDNLP